MNIAQDDIRSLHLNREIRNVSNSIIKKHKLDVKKDNDCKVYYQRVLKNKIDQHMALESIYNHLDKILIEQKIQSNDKKYLKDDMVLILNKIKRLKKEIEE